MSRMQLESKLYWQRDHEEMQYDHMPYWWRYTSGLRKLKKGVLHQRDLGGMFPIRGDRMWNKLYHIRPARAKQKASMTKLLQIYNYNPEDVEYWYDTKLPIHPRRPHAYYW